MENTFRIRLNAVSLTHDPTDQRRDDETAQHKEKAIRVSAVLDHGSSFQFMERGHVEKGARPHRQNKGFENR